MIESNINKEGTGIQNIDIARKTLAESDDSIVVVKNNTILTTKQGEGIKPIMEAIDELGDAMQGSTVGDRILGKASALLCVYAGVKEVYAPQATKSAIAVLIKASIPGQTDKLIPFIINKTGDGICPFEKMLINIDSPEEAYKLLKTTVYVK
jgi:hypothetical protein